ncbi:LysR family transcriptional regulator [Paenibacillus sp. P22]|uniref:LysR family transcriptional regulator n=1 Tax=Paenibacillus sp. P22 TaxID=483908 RepID=UPI0004077941|nr:LysR family transcriptional regulator [Paenibacillus sp. P22]
MELTYLRTFVEVADRGSYTEAAERLGYAQSSVTAQIQKLEEAYGAVLLERRGRRMALTESGETLLGYARQILSLHAESRDAVASGGKGTLTIGTIETVASYYLPKRLQIFGQSHPDMNVALVTGNESQIIKMVKEGSLDAGFILDPPYADPELHVRLIQEQDLLIVTSPEHRFGARNTLSLRDLEGESVILTEEGCTYRALLLQSLRKEAVPCRLSYEFGSLQAIKQGVGYGLGIALLPRIAVEKEIASGQLHAARLDRSEFRFCIQLLYAKRRRVSQAFEAFVHVMSGSGSIGEETAIHRNE